MEVEEEKVKAKVEEFIHKIDPEAKITEIRIREEGAVVNIQSNQSAILIGKEGRTLQDINYLLNLILKRDSELQYKVIIDIGGYREKRLASIRKKALELAKEVRATGKVEEISNLNAYERRIIHLSLEELEGVTTESIGEGKERIIRIIPSS